ncbi:hypothetical protein TSUD_413600, partial [Trifolium subterraneum]
MRGRSRARSNGQGLHAGQVLQSSSQACDSHWVGRDAGYRGERGDWQVVMPRRRKASRPVDRSQDRQRDSKRYDGERDWSSGRGLSWDGYRICNHTPDVRRPRFHSTGRLARLQEVHHDGCAVRLQGRQQDGRVSQAMHVREGSATGRVTGTGVVTKEYRENGEKLSRLWAKVARFDKGYVRGVERESMLNEGRRGGREGSKYEGGEGRIGEHGRRGGRKGKQGAGMDGRDRVVAKKNSVLEERQRQQYVGGIESATLIGPSTQLVRKYSSSGDDVKWARKGVVATVINGEVVSMVQQRIEDAGFSDLVITPMGADKVFIHCNPQTDIMCIINGARQFFNFFFSAFVRWDKEIRPFQRGAWVRLYGVPIHAWSETFFKLCVLDCGRFLRTDSRTLERDRFDYARVLIATSSLEILNEVVTLSVDGVMCGIKIIDEWGFNIGEDACLFKDEKVVSDIVSEHLSDHGDHGDQDQRNTVNAMIENIIGDLEKEDEELSVYSKEHYGHGMVKSHETGPILQGDTILEPSLHTVEQGCSGKLVNQPAQVADVTRCSEKLPECESAVGSLRKTADNNSIPIRGRRHLSCPPGGDRYSTSGPWSLEWIADNNHVEAGIMFSSRKKSHKHLRPLGDHNHEASKVPRKTRAGGVLRHTMMSLKKVARLPSKDRSEVLRILRKEIRKRSGRNKGEHWVALHGSEEVAVEDMRGMGKSIGVKFTGDDNMFQVCSWNTRGLGSFEKRKEVRKLLGEKKALIVCFQETKMGVCDDFFCASLWGSMPHAYTYRPSVGASRGLLVMWDTGEVEVWSSASFNHVVLIHGRVIKSDEEFYIFNVYAPCDTTAKQVLWDSLSGRLQQLAGKKVCVCGDFNVVRCDAERHSVIHGSRSLDHGPFTQFIEDNGLVDLSLSGHSYTWFKGLCDHCPLLSSVDEENWGPRPVRILKCWHDIPGYRQFVIDKWRSMQIDGIEGLKTRLSVLDGKGEDDVFIDEEMTELRSITSDIHSLSRVNASISWQQSRLLWLREGDANSKYFHSVLASRRRQNAVSVIMVDGERVEGMQPVRQAVFNHFSSHFRAGNVVRPTVEDLQFRTLSYAEGGKLVKPFSVEEMRGDIMRFLTEFHKNGKLSKENQTAFVKDRQILDGILIANEVVDEARKLKKELLLFKVDFEKAYDSVDWSYLDTVMRKMSFPTLWRKWIAECVGTVTASVLVNGSPTVEFPMERGLRQGDLLSPFLFLLAAEGLSVMMRAMVQSNLFSGYSIGAENPTVVSHLQFADDTLLLGVKSWANVRALRGVLVLFEK